MENTTKEKLIRRLRRRLSVIDDCRSRAQDSLDELEGTESENLRYVTGQLQLLAESADMAIQNIYQWNEAQASQAKESKTDEPHGDGTPIA